MFHCILYIEGNVIAKSEKNNKPINSPQKFIKILYY
jgi:hypothetical protein